MKKQTREVPFSRTSPENQRSCWFARRQNPASLFFLFLILQFVATSKPAFGVRVRALYDANHRYVGCEYRFNFFEKLLEGARDGVDSPFGTPESLCTRFAQTYGTFIYVSANRFGDFHDLADQALSNFTPPRVRNPDGSFQTPVFDSTRAESGTQTGVGAALRLNDWLTLDLGLTVGSGTGSRTSSQPQAEEEIHFRLFGGSVKAKVYPLQMPVARVQPWLSAGVRGLALRPESGSYSQGEQRLVVPDRDLQPVSTTDFASGAGIDVRLTNRLGVTFSGEHGFHTGWAAGVGLTLALLPRTIKSFPPLPTTEATPLP